MTNFDEIYKLYVKDVYRFLLKLTYNAELSEELTQETFYKAMLHIGQFKGNCKMRVWLCQIAKNEYFNYCSRMQNKNLPLEESTPANENLEELFCDIEESYRIHQILHTIEEPYKEVFTLKIFGELPYREIGRLFEKSEVWARVTFYRAKEKIMTALKEDNYEL